MAKAGAASIAVILDKSGSMDDIREKTIEGFNTFLREQKDVPGTARLTLVQFNTSYEVNYVDRPLSEAPPLTVETYKPSGYTALLDAVGRGIDELGQKLAGMADADRPERVIFVIITDGMENSSREYAKPGRVAGMVKHQQEKYGWQFLYLGAGEGALEQAQAIAVPKANAALYNAGVGGQNVNRVYAMASSKVAGGRGTGMMSWSVAERAALADEPESKSSDPAKP